jgi:hypothetical protein
MGAILERPLSVGSRLRASTLAWSPRLLSSKVRRLLTPPRTLPCCAIRQIKNRDVQAALMKQGDTLEAVRAREQSKAARVMRQPGSPAGSALLPFRWRCPMATIARAVARWADMSCRRGRCRRPAPATSSPLALLRGAVHCSYGRRRRYPIPRAWTPLAVSCAPIDALPQR